MTIFHFDCYAVLSIEPGDDDYPEDCPEINLHGFWADAAAANLASEAIEAARVKAHQADEAKSISRWGWRIGTSPLPAVRYAIVPVRHLGDVDLCDLEGKLKDFVKLNEVGIGVKAYAGGAE